MIEITKSDNESNLMNNFDIENEPSQEDSEIPVVLEVEKPEGKPGIFGYDELESDQITVFTQENNNGNKANTLA